MKTSLKIAAFSFALGLPVVVALQQFVPSLPSALDPVHVLAAFAGSLMLLTVWTEYARAPFTLAANPARLPVTRKAEHPLAA